jgi:hypothetical protein
MAARALWQILVAADSEETAALSCDDCFAILQFLADEAVRGADLGTLREALRRHLEHCPDCRAHHLKRLNQLVALAQAKYP